MSREGIPVPLGESTARRRSYTHTRQQLLANLPGGRTISARIAAPEPIDEAGRRVKGTETQTEHLCCASQEQRGPDVSHWIYIGCQLRNGLMSDLHTGVHLRANIRWSPFSLTWQSLKLRYVEAERSIDCHGDTIHGSTLAALIPMKRCARRYTTCVG